MMDLTWKPDWARTRARFVQWWQHEGLVLWLPAPRDVDVDVPLAPLRRPARPADPRAYHVDPFYRARAAEYELAHTYFGGEAFPFFDSNIGPGNLAAFLGAEPGYDFDTVWFRSCIDDPEAHPPFRFDPANAHFREQLALIEEGQRVSAGRYPAGMPDLIENLDILSALRGPQTLMADLLDRPGWVKARIEQLNPIYFTVFDAFFERIRDEWGGNVFSAFDLWGPGKTAKLQCDASAMFSPAMFARLVAPSLDEQCRWLDYSLYHLDGTQALCHLERLLALEALDAIEWTPQAGLPGGGDARWFPLYRRILAAGKSVQAVGVAYDEVMPLLDAVGPRGLFITTEAPDESSARALAERVESYR